MNKSRQVPGEFNLTEAIDSRSSTHEAEHRVNIMSVFIDYFGSDYEAALLSEEYNQESVEAAIRSIENGGW